LQKTQSAFLYLKGGDNLICPYNNKSETSVQSWVENSDSEDENKKVGSTVTTTTYTQTECQGEKCGAYYNGRCHYKD